MDWLDRELQDSLKRKDPSPDFAERVRWSLHVMKHQPAHGLQWWLTTAAACVIVAGAGGVGYRQHQGEVAKQQVMQAFRIAGSNLSHIQTRVRGANR